MKKQYQTWNFVLLKQCYYCARMGTQKNDQAPPGMQLAWLPSTIPPPTRQWTPISTPKICALNPIVSILGMFETNCIIRLHLACSWAGYPLPPHPQREEDSLRLHEHVRPDHAGDRSGNSWLPFPISGYHENPVTVRPLLKKASIDFFNGPLQAALKIFRTPTIQYTRKEKCIWIYLKITASQNTKYNDKKSVVRIPKKSPSPSPT